MPDAPSTHAPATSTERLITDLFARDPSGRDWLPKLLEATPYGRDRLSELVETPGFLAIPLAVRGASGRLACFEYPGAPPRELLRWYIEHPDRLVWPPDIPLRSEAVRLRRALLHDDPPGSQARARERAIELAATDSLTVPAWWRFEEVVPIGCVLTTERLVVVIEMSPAAARTPATDWYPPRSRLVRALEAAQQLADEGRRYAALLITEATDPDADEAALRRALREGAPHLDAAEREALLGGYLGALTRDEAATAVGAG